MHPETSPDTCGTFRHSSDNGPVVYRDSTPLALLLIIYRFWSGHVPSRQSSER